MARAFEPADGGGGSTPTDFKSGIRLDVRNWIRAATSSELLYKILAMMTREESYTLFVQGTET